MNGVRRILVTLGVFCLTGAIGTVAQDRETIVRNAVALDAEESVREMTKALDLSLGEPDSLWALAAMFTAYQYAVELEDRDLALLWMGWAMRYEPGLPGYRNNYRNNTVVGLMTQVTREFGADTLGTDRTTWDWNGLDMDAFGQLDLGSSQLDDAISVEVDGRGQLVDVMSLPPGMYTVRAIAYGDAVLEYQREVLPGIVTRLNLDLSTVTPPPDFIPPGGEQALGAVTAGGGFPVIAVLGILGAAGGAAAYFVLGSSGGPGGGNDPPPAGTGGIIINYPIR